MKIARVALGDDIHYGIVEGLGEDPYPTGESDGHVILLAGDPLYSVPQATGRVVDLADVRLLAPVIPRSKVVGVGNNYAAHVAELHGEGASVDAQRRAALGEPAVLFLKPNTAVIGPDVPIVLPSWAQEVHYEGELAVVIKTLAKDVPAEQAASVIFGYTVANDVSARDRQREEEQWVRAKGFDTSCPLGPWIEVPEGEGGFDPSRAGVRTQLNGTTVQDGTTADMLRDVYQLVSYVSHAMTLLPGDVILTGTPSGVGAITPGDRVSVGVEGLGAFSNPVVLR